MSDPTPASGEPDEDEEGPVRPRHQSAAERRSSETVMLDSDNLGDMVSQAKAEAAPPAQAETPEAEDKESFSVRERRGETEEEERKNVILIVGVAVVILLAGVIAYLIYIAD